MPVLYKATSCLQYLLIEWAWLARQDLSLLLAFSLLCSIGKRKQMRQGVHRTSADFAGLVSTKLQVGWIK